MNNTLKPINEPNFEAFKKDYAKFITTHNYDEAAVKEIKTNNPNISAYDNVINEVKYLNKTGKGVCTGFTYQINEMLIKHGFTPYNLIIIRKTSIHWASLFIKNNTLVVADAAIDIIYADMLKSPRLPTACGISLDEYLRIEVEEGSATLFVVERIIDDGQPFQDLEMVPLDKFVKDTFLTV